MNTAPPPCRHAARHLCRHSVRFVEARVTYAFAGVKAASINTATLALIDAGIPMLDPLFGTLACVRGATARLHCGDLISRLLLAHQADSAGGASVLVHVSGWTRPLRRQPCGGVGRRPRPPGGAVAAQPPGFRSRGALATVAARARAEAGVWAFVAARRRLNARRRAHPPVAGAPRGCDRGRVLALQMESRVHSDRFELMLETLTDACLSVHRALDSVVQARTARLLDARGS